MNLKKGKRWNQEPQKNMQSLQCVSIVGMMWRYHEHVERDRIRQGRHDVPKM